MSFNSHLSPCNHSPKRDSVYFHHPESFLALSSHFPSLPSSNHFRPPEISFAKYVLLLFSRSIHMVVSVIHSFYCSVVFYCDNNLFTHFSDGSYLGCFQLEALYKHSCTSPFMIMFFLLSKHLERNCWIRV